MTNENSEANSKTTTAIVTIVGVVLLVGVCYIAWLVLGPKEIQTTPVDNPPTSTSCIQLPEVTTETTRNAALEIGAELEKLKLDGDLKAEFANTAKTVYAKLDDKQVALLLLLRAIECYVKFADTPEKKELVEGVVNDLAKTARSMWASSHDLRGDSEELSFKELAILDEDPLGGTLRETLKTYGIQ